MPTPRLLGYDNGLGILSLRGPRRRDAAGPPRHAAVPGPRRALPPGGRAHRDDADARRRADVAGLPALRHRLRRREADLGAGLLPPALPGGVPQRGAAAGRVRRRPRRVQGDRRGAGGRAARALPPRLPQPQPDAVAGSALPDRLPGRAHGPGHLRPGLAAARFLRRPERHRDQRADRLLPGAQGRQRPPKPTSAPAST